MQRVGSSWGTRGDVAASILLPLMASACIPYTVGTTAQPQRPGESSSSLSTFIMPSIGLLEERRGARFRAADYESRWGIDTRSDWGIRIPSGSGLILNYKRLVSDSSSSMLVAIMPGFGAVNLGNHAHFELTLVASAKEPRTAGTGLRSQTQIIPYGGLKVMQVAPLAEGEVHDLPTIGGFLGTRVGNSNFGISPEIGVFYDHSALGVRRGDLVIVPAITVHGDELIAMVRGRPRPRRREEAAPVYSPPVYMPPVYAPPVYTPSDGHARRGGRTGPTPSQAQGRTKRCTGPVRQPCRPQRPASRVEPQ
jgi:hypothetical protein